MSESAITSIFAREILDSRGNPTVEVEMRTKDCWARASAPSGASTGVHEAVELRDGGARYAGKGVQNAVSNINNNIAKRIIGLDCTQQEEIDGALMELDGTPNKAKLGGNATVAVSMAVARLGAHAQDIQLSEWIGRLSGRNPVTLPVPFLNILNGGKHAGNELAIQEFMVAPIGASTFREALQMGSEIYHALGRIIVKKHGVSARNVGDEGGYAPPINDTHAVLDSVSEAIEEAGYSDRAVMAMDSAASSFYDAGKDRYLLDGKEVGTGELLDFYLELFKSYPIVSCEDPFHEEDFKGFAMLNEKSGPGVQVVGDDLTVTNCERVNVALEQNSISCLLLKLNQIGTVTEALNAADMMFKGGKQVMVSHRSGETSDYTMADLAVGISCGQIKSGAPARGERLAKYNELLRIEERLGARANYAGKNFRA
jgi:enolase